jgi:hypothetical protein
MRGARRAVVFAAVCLAVAAVAVAYAAGKGGAPRVVQAQRFELVDGSGKRRAALWVDAEGAARLSLEGAVLVGGGKPSLTLTGKDGGLASMGCGQGSAGPDVTLVGKGGMVTLDARESCGMTAYGKGAAGFTVVGAASNGAPQVRLVGTKDGKERVLWQAP